MLLLPNPKKERSHGERGQRSEVVADAVWFAGRCAGPPDGFQRRIQKKGPHRQGVGMVRACRWGGHTGVLGLLRFGQQLVQGSRQVVHVYGFGEVVVHACG